MFGVDAGNTGFDAGEREFGNIAVEAPAWEATPALYPGLSLQWGAFMDAGFGVTLDGSGNVAKWVSKVASPSVYPSTTVPFYFTVYGPGGTQNPVPGSLSPPPGGGSYIYFDGVNDTLLSGAAFTKT